MNEDRVYTLPFTTSSDAVEDIIIRYQKGENFSATIIGRGVDSSTIVYILRAVQEKDFQHLKRLKENINFSCIVIDNGNETVI